MVGIWDLNRELNRFSDLICAMKIWFEAMLFDLWFNFKKNCDSIWKRFNSQQYYSQPSLFCLNWKLWIMPYDRNRPVLDLEDHATIRYSHCDKCWKQLLQAVTLLFSTSLTSAKPLIHRPALWKILRMYGLPEQIIYILQNLYQDSKCAVIKSIFDWLYIWKNWKNCFRKKSHRKQYAVFLFIVWCRSFYIKQVRIVIAWLCY